MSLETVDAKQEEERSLAMVEMMESSAERLEEVLQQVQGEVSNVVDKLDDIKMEVQERQHLLAV